MRTWNTYPNGKCTGRLNSGDEYAAGGADSVYDAVSRGRARDDGGGRVDGGTEAAGAAGGRGAAVPDRDQSGIPGGDPGGDHGGYHDRTGAQAEGAPLHRA